MDEWALRKDARLGRRLLARMAVPAWSCLRGRGDLVRYLA